MTLDPLFQVAAGLTGMCLVMLAMWLLQRRTRDAGVVDVAWTLGVGGLTVFYALTSGGDPLRRLVLVVMALAWSLRLGLFLLTDRVLSEGEDGRYRDLRESWGERAQVYLLILFESQALLAILFSLPSLVVAWNPRSGLDALVIAALCIWLLSLVGEALADRQLARFRGRPENRGKTCREGLWRLSRHPNYFFEWLQWWSYVLLAIGSPHAWLALIGPAVMLLLLFRVTGIPATEAQALRSRGEDYRAYQRTTSVFVPWFPREET